MVFNVMEVAFIKNDFLIDFSEFIYGRFSMLSVLGIFSILSDFFKDFEKLKNLSYDLSCDFCFFHDFNHKLLDYSKFYDYSSITGN